MEWWQMPPGLPAAYLDSTIPSFYCEDRPTPILQVWKQITVQFWDSAPGRFQHLISDEKVRELQEPS
jgi:hypothetical protein